MWRKNLTNKLVSAWNGFNYLLPGGYAFLPPVIIFEVTFRCNLKCNFCILFDKGSNFNMPSELTFDQIKKAIDNLSRSYRHLPYKPLIGFIGGEPFMRKDFLKILKYAKMRGFRFAVTTNFSVLSHNDILELIALKPFDIRISLDGPEKIHDAIRGVKGTFKNVERNLASLRHHADGKKIPVRLNCVINDKNIGYLEYLITFARKYSCSLSFQHLIFLDEPLVKAHNSITAKFFGKPVVKAATSHNLDKKFIMRMEKTIPSLIQESKRQGVPLSFTPDLKVNELMPYYFDLKGYRHSKRCKFIYGTARILPSGEVNSCMVGYSYGDIKKQPFSDIWNSKKARHFRNTVKKVGLFPGCARCCKI